MHILAAMVHQIFIMNIKYGSLTIFKCLVGDCSTKWARFHTGIGSNTDVVFNVLLQASDFNEQIGSVNGIRHQSFSELQWHKLDFVDDDDTILINGRDLLPSHHNCSGGKYYGLHILRRGCRLCKRK